MPLQSDLAKLYTGYYTHAGEMSDIPKQIRSSAIRRAIANLVPWRKVQLLPRLFYLEDLPAGRLLEVGCGAGGASVTGTARLRIVSPSSHSTSSGSRVKNSRVVSPLLCP